MESHGPDTERGTGRSPRPWHAPSTQPLPRADPCHNASLVLRALRTWAHLPRGYRPPHRADEDERRRGSSPTSSATGWQENVGKGTSTGGKQPTLVALRDDARTVIVLDLGERGLRRARANLRRTLTPPGRDREAATATTPSTSSTASSTSSCRGDEPHPRHRVNRAGSIVDADGTIRWAVDLDWQDLPLARIVEERHALPTVVANDSRAAALATYLFQGDERPQNLIVVRVGRGIGAGIILRDQPFGGDGEGAGEIGHVVVEPDGAACHCGRFGCLETVASAPAVVKAAEATTIEVATRAANGDEVALGVVRQAGRRSARASPA